MDIVATCVSQSQLYELKNQGGSWASKAYSRGGAGWGVKGRNSPTEGGGQLRPVLPVDPPGQGYCNEDTAS